MEGMANEEGDEFCWGFFWLAERVKSGDVAASDDVCRLLVGWEGVIKAEDDDSKMRNTIDAMNGMAVAWYNIVDDFGYYHY